MKIYLVLIIIIIGLTSCSSSLNNDTKAIDETIAEDQYSRQLLDFVLLNTANQNINQRVSIEDCKDINSVLKALEPILFEVYGKEDIIEQKPYKISFIDDYWIIEGVQKEVHPGGVFQLVLNCRNNTLIYLIHGK